MCLFHITFIIGKFNCIFTLLIEYSPHFRMPPSAWNLFNLLTTLIIYQLTQWTMHGNQKKNFEIRMKRRDPSSSPKKDRMLPSNYGHIAFFAQGFLISWVIYTNDGRSVDKFSWLLIANRSLFMLANCWQLADQQLYNHTLADQWFSDPRIFKFKFEKKDYLGHLPIDIKNHRKRGKWAD
jgi:hypothetical protein